VTPEEVRALRPGTSDKDFTEASDWLARSQDGRV
jgi:prephenate dehydratase